MRKETNWPALAGVALVLVLVLVGGGACKKKTEAPAPSPAPAPPPVAVPVQVTAVELGREVGADKRVTVPTDQFNAGDTIYAVVLTSGTAASASLTARFTYQDGQVVAETPQTVALSGAAATEFHISKPDGWPAGDYRVVILLDGQEVASKSFAVVG